jgi:hypothetical protein
VGLLLVSIVSSGLPSVYSTVVRQNAEQAGPQSQVDIIASAPTQNTSEINGATAVHVINNSFGRAPSPRYTISSDLAASPLSRRRDDPPEVSMVQPASGLFERASQPTQLSQNEHQHGRATSLHHSNQQAPQEIHTVVRESPAVSEEDAHLKICQEMSKRVADSVSPTQLGQPTQGREIIEYHGGTNSMTILAEVLGQKQPKRLVRITLQESERPHDSPQPGAGLDRADAEYLDKKGVFTIPPRCCWYAIPP